MSGSLSFSKVNWTSYKLATSCNDLFTRYLEQVAGTSYRKLKKKVRSCYNNLQVAKSYRNEQ